MAPVTDLKDVRVMIPRVRRALDGPMAIGSGSVSSTLSDEEMTGLIADGVADVIFYTGGATVFGHSLEVTARDPYYMAPIAWQTSEELTLPEQTVVVAQCAINYIFRVLSDTKISETIRDEAGEWTYSISASVMRDWLSMLKQARDKALEEVSRQGAALESYYSYVAVRDVAVAALIEPWVVGGTGQGGMELVDVRSGWLPD